MTVPHAVDVLVIGGGATGAGVLRDLSRRGLKSLLVERSDFGTGTTGRFHGLLHSGGRYVGKDKVAARECIVENRILRRIAPASVEDTGGYFVATPDDPDDYVDAFAENCNLSGVDCDEVRVADLLAKEPALNPKIRRAFRVPDGSIEPWQLIEATVTDARQHGSEALAYHRVVGMVLNGGRIAAVNLRDERTGTVSQVWTHFVVSAAGAWASQIAAFANVSVEMTPGKGTMLIYNHRMTDAVVNRCHRSADGDIMVPVHTVAILGTTDIKVPDPDGYDITREEVQRLVSEGAKMFPDLPRMRILRSYAGVRPLYQPPAATVSGAGNRAITRAHAILDHADQGVDNFVSIVGGKLTTHRLMAEETVDAVAAKMGVTAPCTTADEVLPDQESGHHLLAGPPPGRPRGGGRRRRRPAVRVRAGHPEDGRRLPRPALALLHRRRATRHARRHGPVPGRLLHVPGCGPGRRATGRAHRGDRPPGARRARRGRASPGQRRPARGHRRSGAHRASSGSASRAPGPSPRAASSRS